MLTGRMANLDGIEMPSGPLEAALTAVTEKLAHELANPSAAAPDWSDLYWRVARGVVAMHGVAGLLSHILRWRGPEPWALFLEEQRAHITRRHARIDELLLQIDRRARASRIAFLGLKGVALHALGLYTPGLRPMADVDLLVHPSDAARAVNLIESMGYRESRRSYRERGFAPLDSHIPGPLGEHSGNDITIELHERICERLPWDIMDLTEAVWSPQLRFGLNGYPSRAALMTHLLSHAAGNMIGKSVRLVQLHDLALVARQMSERDWDELLRWSSRRLWWALPPLSLALRYYPVPIPAPVLTALQADCPPILRRRAPGLTVSEASLSYPWVDAFPGIEWARSVREKLRYAANRIRPSTEHLAARSVLAAGQDWAFGSRWAALSQGRRIARWLVSRQVRPATLHVLRASLAAGQ